MEAEEEKPEFKIIDGLRYVVPYKFILRTYTKKRWFDRGILEVLSQEFQAYPASYYETALSSGRITVNDKTVRHDYLLQDHDFIAHHVHRHEPPVIDGVIQTIAECEEILVVNKPASIPIHTTGRYRHNTLLKHLETKHGQKLFTCHRLDRLTSGIIVLLKTTQKAKEYGALFRAQKVSKTYLALCDGEFPVDGLSCSEPILQVSHKLGINKVDHVNGKAAHTDFKRLHYDRATNRSLVLCLPQTGKMHQIRVHLAHRGYPITNDPIYSRENWAKKSTDEFSKELTEVLFRNDNISTLISSKMEDNVSDKLKQSISTGEKECSSEPPDKEAKDKEPTDKEAKEADTTADTVKNDTTVSEDSLQQSAGHCTVSGDGIKQAAEISITPEGKFCLDGKVYARIPRLSYEEGCPECSWIRLVPDAQDMFIFLHAVRYELDGKFYVSPLPEWCPKEWIPEEFHQLLQMSPSA